MNIIKGVTKRPRRVLLYGTHGIGKTSWAAQSPSPIFLATEDGQADVGVDRTPLLKDLGSVNTWISDLLTQEHEYRTVVIDTLDWLEKLIFNQVCAGEGKENIEKIGYAKGYTYAVSHWEFLLKSLDHLREQRKMAVILLAHSRTVRVEEPDKDTYTKYEPDLDKRVCPMLQEWADEVLFARYRVDTLAKDEGFNRERVRAIGTSERIVFTAEGPGWMAKRRVQMPDVIPLDFAVYASYLKSSNGHATGNINGVVVNGSSKTLEPAMAG